MGKIDKTVLPCVCGHRMECHVERTYDDDEYWEPFYSQEFDEDDDYWEVPEYVGKMVAYMCEKCDCDGFKEMTNFEYVEWVHKRRNQ